MWETVSTVKSNYLMGAFSVIVSLVCGVCVCVHLTVMPVCLCANARLRLCANMVGICFAMITNRICGPVCVFVCTSPI